MGAPVRLQLSRRKGFDLQALSQATNGLPAVNVARPSKWGNPFVVGEPCDRKQIARWGWRFGHPEFVCDDASVAVRRFRGCLFKAEDIHGYVRAELRGKNLACWCAIHRNGEYVPCHADVLLSLANDIPLGGVISENLRRAKGEAAQ